MLSDERQSYLTTPTCIMVGYLFRNASYVHVHVAVCTSDKIIITGDKWWTPSRRFQGLISFDEMNIS